MTHSLPNKPQDANPEVLLSDDRPAETVADVDVTLTLSVRVVGEFMNAQELGDLIESSDLTGAFAEAFRDMLRCRERSIGYTPDGNREAWITAILDVDRVETGARYLTEKGA